MKNNIKLIMLIIIFATFALHLSASKLPSFTVETLNAGTLRSEALLEKGPLFIEFWNVSCQPCLRFLPHVSRFAEEFPGITFLAISTDSPRNRSRVQQIIRSNNYQFITGLDPSGDLARTFKVSSVPRTIIADKDGNIVYDGTGYSSGDESKYEEILNKLVGKTR